jgi:hypothetical protein
VSAPKTITPTRRLREWQKKVNDIVDRREKATEDEFVAIYEMRKEGLSYAAIGGMFMTHPTGIPAKVERGAAIVAARKSRIDQSDG